MAEELKIDVSSPYYLGAGDQPGNLITHVILKGENYLTWSRAITLSFKSRRKFGFVDGTITKPTENKKLLDWETNNSMLVSWILRTIDSKITSSIPYIEEAKKLWDYLEKRFCVSTGPRIQQLRANIIGCKQTKNMPIEDYYNTLMGFFDDLNQLKPPHGCECGKCTCNVAEKYAKDKEEEKLHQFLIGIDDELYATVRTNLLSQQPPTNLESSLEALLQEEHSRRIAKGKADEAHIFALPPDRWRASTERKDKTKLTCSHCQKSGHDSATCFKIHGYPEWWGDKSRIGKGGANSSRMSSTTTHERNKAGNVRANYVSSTTGGAVNNIETTAVNSGTDSPLAGLKPEQVQILLNMINQKQQDKMIGKFSPFSWIIDTGATHHVTGNESCLANIQSILPRPVGLPDGKQALAVKEGCVMLTDGLILEHVLLVPKLHCNLVSVSQIIDDLKCYVHFTESLCAIQDQCSGSLIGAGERKDGLYYF